MCNQGKKQSKVVKKLKHTEKDDQKRGLSTGCFSKPASFLSTIKNKKGEKVKSQRTAAVLQTPEKGKK